MILKFAGVGFTVPELEFGAATVVVGSVDENE
jgi:hypothetical protein